MIGNAHIEKTIAHIESVMDQFGSSILITENGDGKSAVLPHLVLRVCADKRPLPPIVFVDTGYYTVETHTQIEAVADMGFNVSRYAAMLDPEDIEKEYPNWWEDDAPYRDRVIVMIKHEPLNRAFERVQPSVWMSRIMHWETPERAHMGILEERGGLLHSHPIIHWTKAHIDAYIAQHALPTHRNHIDLTKGLAQNRECQIHFACGKAR